MQELDEYLQDVQRNRDTETGAPLRPVEQKAWQRFAARSDTADYEIVDLLTNGATARTEQ